MPVTVLALAIFFQSGCFRRHTGDSPSNSISSNPYVDFLELKAGAKVQVVIPITKSGSYILPSIRQQQNGNDVEIEAGDDFIGYEKAFYKVTPKDNEGIQIRFSHATEWEDGKTSSRQSARLKLFEDLAEFRHIRLVYLTRESHADHNMAIVASNDSDALKVSTNAVTRTAQCLTNQIVVCKWVPEGVAVTVENRR